MFSDYIAKVKKVSGSRKHSITKSYGVNEAYRHYVKSGGILTRRQYGEVIRYINSYNREELASGKEIKLPCGFGTLALRKSKRGIKEVDGKLTITYPVDWESTLKLWYEDEEARQRKQLVKSISDTVFMVVYPNKGRTYSNSPFYGFAPGRKLKIRLKDRVKENSVDAFLNRHYETRYN